jgi:PAS domain S-box-containing protein
MSSNKSKSNPKAWQLVQDIKNMELEIDARKQIERVLKSREDRFKTIFNHAPVAYFLLDHNGNFVDGNLTSFELTGYNKEELFGKTFTELNLIENKDQKAISELIKRSMRGDYTGPDEFSMIKKDGSRVIIEIRTSPVTVTNEKLVLSIAHDITDRKLSQKKLQDSEERFRKLFDSAHDAIMTLNPPTWKFTSGNPAMLKMFKVKSVKEFLTYGPWNISPEKQPDGRLSSEKAKEMIKIAMTNGSNFFEWTHKRMNGNSFSATVLLTKIRIKDKTFLQATVKDITKRKKAEKEIEQKTKELKEQFKISEKQRVATLSTLSDLNDTTKELQFEIAEREKTEKALRENEEKYHSLTENIPLGIYRNTPGAKGKFIEVNKTFVDMFGFKDREAMLAANVSSLYVSPGEREKYSDKILAKGSIKNEELKLQRQDGSTFIGSSSASVVKDENGKVIHYDGYIEDVTERRELRDQLLESEEKFRSIVNNSPDIILRIDSRGEITYINYEYSYQKPEDILGKIIYDFMPVDFQEIARSTIENVFKTGNSFSFDNLSISTDDNILWYRNNVAPLNKNGKVVAATIIVTDISEQKQIEIMKNEFVSSVSHELRTPLTIIRESLSLLSEGLFGELNKDQLDIINPCMEDVDRLARIINNLIDISRIEGQKIELARETVDIVNLAQGVVSSFRNQATTKNIELVFTPNCKSINLYLDKDRMIQVFMNLIGNSMKFTKKGKIEVFITKNANDVECCIADTGRGIESKDLGTLFDRFHQVGRVMRAGEKGSGLGLSISKGIVKLHNGRIWIDSKINEGSKFHFTLPIYSANEIIIENIEYKIKKVADKHIKFSLLLIKLKNFSNIVSKFGIDIANKVMRSTLKIIQDTLAPGDFSFMKEKDEIILFSDITKQNIIILFSKLEDILAKSVLDIDKFLTIDLSYGYSLYPDKGDNAGKLLQNANKVLLKNIKA